MTRQVFVQSQSFPIAGDFRISRGAKTSADVVYVEISEGSHKGRGECLPYPRYGESQASVCKAIADVKSDIEAGADRQMLTQLLPPGAARNALDCALWDLEAKQKSTPVWQLAGLPEPRPIETAFTLSLGTPDEMRTAAKRENKRPLLKAKLGRQDTALDQACLLAVRENAPDARLIVDANEGWQAGQLEQIAETAARGRYELIEQPLPAKGDDMLKDFQSPVPIGADESFHTPGDLERIAAKYQCVNIKLDKTGGLTEALACCQEARRLGLQVMIGCMVSTSLSMAPALLLAQDADFVDLDGSLLLARDRQDGLSFQGSTIFPAPAALWGHP
ncbi:MAG: dipeptide epimerase [Alphaproteobacteria bacterium]|nr:MAG: dipeptide epimerase [Alphaproteobacteria bacterium]